MNSSRLWNELSGLAAFVVVGIVAVLVTILLAPSVGLMIAALAKGLGVILQMGM
jgi:hypothetical protein